MPEEAHRPPQATDWIERAADDTEARRAPFGSRSSTPTDGTFLGQIGIGRSNWEQLIGEIFYWLAAPARGRGVARRARSRLLDARGRSTCSTSPASRSRSTPTTKRRNASAQAAGLHGEGVLALVPASSKSDRMDAVMFSRLPD